MLHPGIVGVTLVVAQKVLFVASKDPFHISVDNVMMRQEQEHLSYPKMPLAIYQEVVAHLRQVEGVNTGLLEQQCQVFDYSQSQVRGIWIENREQLPSDCQAKIEAILGYYSQFYGPWQML